MSLKWYSFRCHTFTCRGLCGPVPPPGSTEIPTVHATFLWVLATLNSYKLKPLPARSLVWYLTMGHLTKGWMAPDIRWRAMWHALAHWALCLQIFRAIWLNHMAAARLVEVGFRIRPFQLGTMAAAYGAEEE